MNRNQASRAPRPKSQPHKRQKQNNGLHQTAASVETLNDANSTSNGYFQLPDLFYDALDTEHKISAILGASTSTEHTDTKDPSETSPELSLLREQLPSPHYLVDYSIATTCQFSSLIPLDWMLGLSQNIATVTTTHKTDPQSSQEPPKPIYPVSVFNPPSFSTPLAYVHQIMISYILQLAGSFLPSIFPSAALQSLPRTFQTSTLTALAHLPLKTFIEAFSTVFCPCCHALYARKCPACTYQLLPLHSELYRTALAQPPITSLSCSCPSSSAPQHSHFRHSFQPNHAEGVSSAPSSLPSRKLPSSSYSMHSRPSDNLDSLRLSDQQLSCNSGAFTSILSRLIQTYVFPPCFVTPASAISSLPTLSARVVSDPTQSLHCLFPTATASHNNFSLSSLQSSSSTFATLFGSNISPSIDHGTSTSSSLPTHSPASGTCSVQRLHSYIGAIIQQQFSHYNLMCSQWSRALQSLWLNLLSSGFSMPPQQTSQCDSKIFAPHMTTPNSTFSLANSFYLILPSSSGGLQSASTLFLFVQMPCQQVLQQNSLPDMLTFFESHRTATSQPSESSLPRRVPSRRANVNQSLSPSSNDIPFASIGAAPPRPPAQAHDVCECDICVQCFITSPSPQLLKALHAANIPIFPFTSAQHNRGLERQHVSFIEGDIYAEMSLNNSKHPSTYRDIPISATHDLSKPFTFNSSVEPTTVTGSSALGLLPHSSVESVSGMVSRISSLQHDTHVNHPHVSDVSGAVFDRISKHISSIDHFESSTKTSRVPSLGLILGQTRCASVIEFLTHRFGHASSPVYGSLISHLKQQLDPFIIPEETSLNSSHSADHTLVSHRTQLATEHALALQSKTIYELDISSLLPILLSSSQFTHSVVSIPRCTLIPAPYPLLSSRLASFYRDQYVPKMKARFSLNQHCSDSSIPHLYKVIVQGWIIPNAMHALWAFLSVKQKFFLRLDVLSRVVASTCFNSLTLIHQYPITSKSTTLISPMPSDSLAIPPVSSAQQHVATFSRECTTICNSFYDFFSSQNNGPAPMPFFPSLDGSVPNSTSSETSPSNVFLPTQCGFGIGVHGWEYQMCLFMYLASLFNSSENHRSCSEPQQQSNSTFAMLASLCSTTSGNPPLNQPTTASPPAPPQFTPQPTSSMSLAVFVYNNLLLSLLSSQRYSMVQSKISQLLQSQQFPCQLTSPLNWANLSRTLVPIHSKGQSVLRVIHQNDNTVSITTQNILPEVIDIAVRLQDSLQLPYSIESLTSSHMRQAISSIEQFSTFLNAFATWVDESATAPWNVLINQVQEHNKSNKSSSFWRFELIFDISNAVAMPRVSENRPPVEKNRVAKSQMAQPNIVLDKAPLNKEDSTMYWVKLSTSK